ncbi:hypothetical protein H4582DRAFT_2082091 [Lactarius indigo]|nr:hypothetical protein H4582DRAFT_2082091 [Lactarius indigo]
MRLFNSCCPSDTPGSPTAIKPITHDSNGEEFELPDIDSDSPQDEPASDPSKGFLTPQSNTLATLDSDAWPPVSNMELFFDKFYNEDGEKMRWCNACLKEGLSEEKACCYGLKTGNSNLWKHLVTKHEALYRDTAKAHRWKHKSFRSSFFSYHHLLLWVLSSMELSQNRFAALWEPSPSPTLHEAPPLPPIQTALNQLAMEAAVAKTYQPTPNAPLLVDDLNTLVVPLTPAGPPAPPNNMPEDLNTLVPEPTPMPALALTGDSVATSPPPVVIRPTSSLTPTPDTAFEWEARTIHRLWMDKNGRAPPESLEHLQRNYSINRVGDPTVWDLACWMHRVLGVIVTEFLIRHHPSDVLLAAVEHAFATRLTRLQEDINKYSTHATSAREAILSWRANGGRPFDPALAGMIGAAPDDPASSSASSDAAAAGQALQRVTRHSGSIVPPLSRRPSITFWEASAAPDPAPAGDGDSTSSSTPTPTPAAQTTFPEGPLAPMAVALPVAGPIVPDMGHAAGAGHMTSAYVAPSGSTPTPPLAAYWELAETRTACAVLDELHQIAVVWPSQIPDAPDPNTLMAWADCHRRELNAQRLGYTYYVWHEPLLPLPCRLLMDRGENLTHAFDLVSAALTLGIGPPNQQDECALSSNSWLHGVTILLSSVITGILDSTSFFKQSTFSLDPCDDTYHFDETMPVPEIQLGLIKELVAQLSSELTATGNRVMDEEAKWTHIRQMEVIEYKNQIRTELELEFEEWRDELLTSLVGCEVDDALWMLLARLEVDSDRLKDQAVWTCQALAVMTELQEWWKAEYDATATAAEREAFLDSVRDDYRHIVMKEAETKWHLWKDSELAKAKAEALHSLSLDYVLEKCGDDAAALVAEKREFAKGYVAAQYQTWVGQALEEHWPSVEAEAQKWMRDQYLNLELTRIWPEVGAEAKADTARQTEKYREKLWNTAKLNADADHREEQAIAALKQKKKQPKSKTGKQAVDAARGCSPAPLSGSKHSSDGVARSSSVVSIAAPAAFVPEETDMPMALTDSSWPAEVGVVTASVAAGVLDHMAPAYDPGYTSSVEDLYLGPPIAPPVEGAHDDLVGGADWHEMVAPLQIDEEAATLRDVHSSMHNPANAMEDDPSTPRGLVRAADGPLDQEQCIIAAVRELLAPITAHVEHLMDTVRTVDLRTRPGPHPLPAKPADLPVEREETPFLVPKVPLRSLSPAPALTPVAPSTTSTPTPAPQGTDGGSPSLSAPPKAPRRWQSRKRTGVSSSAPAPPGREDFPALVPTAAPSVPTRAVAASAPGTGSHTVTVNNGFISVGRRGPLYSVLMAKNIQQQTTATAQALAHAAAQGRTPAGNLKPTASPSSRLVTKVVVVCYGGLDDKDVEKKLCATNPGHIVHGVHTAIERQTVNPIHLLSGNWSVEVAKTGNFVYMLVGKVPMEHVLTFSKFLCQPFPGSRLVPSEGWCWAQLQDVVVADPDGTIYDQDNLTEELACNPCFKGVALVKPPRWMMDVTRIRSATSMVVFTYIDPTKSITKLATKAGISMFSYGVKFVFASDSPRPKQCGRCFEMGHVLNAPACKWNGKNCCVRCGSAHHIEDHDFLCAGPHKQPGICDCRFPCLLCKKHGHNACSPHVCPVQGDFPPPRCVPKVTSAASAPPAAPRSILKCPTKPEMPSPPSARVDDGPPDPSPPADVNLFDDEALAALASTPNTVKAGELPAERAAKRSRAYSPTSVQGPMAPAFSKTCADSHIVQTGAATASLSDAPRMVQDNNGGPCAGLRPESVVERIRDMFPGPVGQLRHSTSNQVVTAMARLRQMATEAHSEEVIVTVGGVRYAAPFDDLCPCFHALRNEEGSYLLGIIHDEPVVGVNPGTIAAYEALALTSRAFGSHDLLGQPLSEPAVPTAIPLANKPIFPPCITSPLEQ